MERFSGIWWARTLGGLALCLVLGVGLIQGEALMPALERATWAMLASAVGGLVLGNLLRGVLEGNANETGESASGGPVDAPP